MKQVAATPQEFAAYAAAGGAIYHAYCHECKVQGLYYGPEKTPDGFRECPLCGGEGLDLVPLEGQKTLLRGALLHLPDGSTVRCMEDWKPAGEEPKRRAVLVVLQDGPGTVTELRERSGLTEGAVRGQLKHLAGRGLARMIPGKQPQRWCAAQEAA